MNRVTTADIAILPAFVRSLGAATIQRFPV
jgi:hypothetical protein